jgi:hypothetical protein
MGLPEKIDNWASMPRGKYETEQKKQMHRLNRRTAKRFLHREEEPPSYYGKYKGWTTRARQGPLKTRTNAT